MSNKSERPKRFSLVKHAPQKIISILVAIILWLMVMDYENPETTKTFRDIPINYTSVERLAEDKLYSETELNETIDITVQGRRRDVLALKNDDLMAQVDMANLKSGVVELPVIVSCKSEKVTILNSNKPLIRVVLDDIVEVHKAVQHFAEGELPSDLIVLNKKITPSIVQINGPKKLIDTIDNVIIAYSLADVNSSFSFSDSLVIVDVEGQIIKGLTLSDERVRVDVTVGKVTELPIKYNYKPFENQELKVIKKTETTDKVTVRGSVEDLKQLNKISSAEIVVPEEVGKHRLAVKLQLPEGVVQVKPLLIEASVEVDIEEERELALTAADVVALNLDAALDYKIVDGFQHDLMLRGYSAAFQDGVFERPQIEIDFKNLTAGEHLVPFVVKLDDRLSVENAGRLRGEVMVVLKAKE